MYLTDSTYVEGVGREAAKESMCRVDEKRPDWVTAVLGAADL